MTYGTGGGAPARANAMGNSSPAWSEQGLYVTKDLLEAVPEELREDYTRSVREFASRKYQLGVEVARQLPGVLSEGGLAAADRYLDSVRVLAEINWRAGVEAAKYLYHLQVAPDPLLAEGYRTVVTAAVSSSDEDAEADAAATELAALERELAAVERARERADRLRSELSRRRSREEHRHQQAIDLAANLPAEAAAVPLARRDVFLEQVRVVATVDPEAGVGASASLSQMMASQRLSPEGATQWTERGLEALEQNLEVGRAYFRLATKQALQLAEELREGLRLRSVARILKLYATALSGKDVAIRGLDEMEAIDAYGANHIVLPGELHYFEDDHRNFTAFKVATAHGAGRIEFGTYGFSLEDIPEVVAELRRRYGERE